MASANFIQCAVCMKFFGNIMLHLRRNQNCQQGYGEEYFNLLAAKVDKRRERSNQWKKIERTNYKQVKAQVAQMEEDLEITRCELNQARLEMGELLVENENYRMKIQDCKMLISDMMNKAEMK